VHLNKKFSEFQHNGIPCIHAIAVCLVCKKEPEKYIRSFLKAKSFAKLYRGSIPPINFSEFHAEGTVMSPKTKKQRGRPKKKTDRCHTTVMMTPTMMIKFLFDTADRLLGAPVEDSIGKRPQRILEELRGPIYYKKKTASTRVFVI
jgi:hypothetical protein